MSNFKEQIKGAIKEIKWKAQQVSHQTGTATKLGFTVQAKHLQEIKEIYDDLIFRIEMIVDESEKEEEK